MPNTQNASGYLTVVAGEALEQFRRVKLSSNEAVYADAGEASIGVTQGKYADGAPVSIKLWNSGGTFIIEAAGAITADASVYGATDGKIDDTVSGDAIGVAREAAGAAAALIEIVLTSEESSGQLNVTQINDSSGNESLIITATASAVNEITLANAATAGDPALTASGGDTNVGIDIQGKGTGAVTLQAYDVDGSTYVDVVQASGNATDVTLALTASGGITVNNDTTMADSTDIVLNTGTGTLIGTAAGQKIGFLGVAAPATQQATIAAADTNPTTLVARVDSLIAVLDTFGFTATA